MVILHLTYCFKRKGQLKGWLHVIPHWLHLSPHWLQMHFVLLLSWRPLLTDGLFLLQDAKFMDGITSVYQLSIQPRLSQIQQMVQGMCDWKG